MLITFTFIDHAFGELGYSRSEGGKKSVETGATEKVE
jgi:hypothetical protein